MWGREEIRGGWQKEGNLSCCREATCEGSHLSLLDLTSRRSCRGRYRGCQHRVHGQHRGGGRPQQPPASKSESGSGAPGRTAHSPVRRGGLPHSAALAGPERAALCLDKALRRLPALSELPGHLANLCPRSCPPSDRPAAFTPLSLTPAPGPSYPPSPPRTVCSCSIRSIFAPNKTRTLPLLGFVTETHHRRAAWGGGRAKGPLRRVPSGKTQEGRCRQSRGHCQRSLVPQKKTLAGSLTNQPGQTGR